MYRKLLYLSFTLLLIVYYFVADQNMDRDVIYLLLLVVGLSSFLFFYRRDNFRNLDGQFFRHSTFAVVGLLIVNFQYYIDFLIGNIPATNIIIFVNPSVVVKTLTLSSIGLLLFFIGYLSYTGTPQKIVPERTLGTIFLEVLLFVFLVLYFLTIDMKYVLGGYGSGNRGAGVSYIALFFKILIIAIVIQKARNLILSGNTNLSFKKYLINLGLIFNISLGLYLLTVLLSGDRGPLITFSIIVFAGYLFVTKRKFKKRYGIIVLFLGASIITLLGIARSYDSGLSFSDKMQMAFQESPFSTEESFLPQTKELAGSIKANHHAVDFVPSQHDFLWGRFQLQQFTAAMPFFNIFNTLLFDDVSRKYAGSASFVTWIYQGDYPSYGNGTSVIADFYFDFGLLGVILGMFLYGYFIRKAEVSMYSGRLPGLFVTVFSIVYIGSALYIARSSFLFEFRTVVWVYAILLLNRHVFNTNAQNR